MPLTSPLFESLETRTLFAASTQEPVCLMPSVESILYTSPNFHCSVSESDDSADGAESEERLRPSGTSKIDAYPESKGWFGDLWEHVLTMAGWR